MGKWFGQASEIEELRAENRQLKEQVANLEARLRAAYADARVTALAGSASPTFEAAAPTPVPGTPSPASASLPELNAVEIQMIAEGRMIYAVKTYKDRTGLDLKQREMITFCFLAAQGGCEPQLTSHAKGNMNLGNDQAFLVKVVSQCLPYIGYPRSLNAIRCIENAAKQ